MNEIQRPTNPIYGRSIGDFVFQTLFPLILLLVLTISAGAQDCTMSWSQENYININPYHSFECVTTVHPSDILTFPEDCMGEKTVTLYSLSDLSTPIDVDPIMPGAQVDENYVGQRLHVEVRHVETGEKAVAYVTIQDYREPELKCKDTYITCFEDIRPVSEGGDVEDIVIHDCSEIATSSYADNPEFYLCDGEYGTYLVGKIIRKWTVTDVYGNSSSCDQAIFIYRMGLSNGAIEPPADLDIECSEGPEAKLPTNTGYPKLKVGLDYFKLKPSNVGMCDIEVDYFDAETTGYCVGSGLIIRTWTIKDLCFPIEENVNPVILVQKIHIKDRKGPTVDAPGSLTLGTSNQECSTNVTFPPAVVSDLCSDVSVSIHTDFGVINANGGTLYGVPAGHHTAVYKAKDNCDNVTEKTIWVTVLDDDAPNVVCDQFTAVPLNEDGFAQVQAMSFDDGSTDNCEIVAYKVSRMASNCQPEDTPFGDFVEFSCCDLGTNVMVALKVIDAAGNFNICMIEVTVQDKVAPLIICHPDKVLDCIDDYTNTAFTGVPTVTDNCGIERVYHEDVSIDLNDCGWGTVIRKWIAEDKGGNQAECYQTITITNTDPFKESDISWPDNYTTTTCGADIDPDNLPYPFGRPKLTTRNCDNVQSYFEDLAIGDQGGAACFEIHRTWYVVDLCMFDPNDEMPVGKWTYVQKLYIDDQTKPVYTKGHENILVEVDGNCHDIPYTIMADVDDCSPNLTYYYQVDLHKNGVIDFSGNGQMADLLFPAGEHIIKWRVADGCGNEKTAEQKIYFKDTKAPVANMKAIFMALMPIEGGGMLEVNAKAFNNSSMDNCTSESNLIFSYSEDITDTVKMFTCAEKGQYVLDIYVHDEEGNFAFASTFADIQDPSNNCPEVLASVSGLITTQTGKAISNVEVKVEGSGLQPLMTDATGAYNVESLPGGTFMLKPSKDIEAMNGVSTYDMVLMQRHILGLAEINDPYTMIAADVNNSGSISTSDMVAMRRLILDVSEDFGGTQSWRFVHAEHSFDPNDVFGAAFPEVYPLNNPSGNMQVDFIGIKVGDINDNASTSDLLGNGEQQGEDLSLLVQDQELKSGERYEVAFKATAFQDIVGFQYTLDFDKTAIQINDFVSGALELDQSNHSTRHIDDGLIPMNWFNALPVSINDKDVLFTLSIEATRDIKLSEALTIGSEKTKSEAYRQQSMSSPMEVGEALIQYIEIAKPEVNAFELSQNAPNPFRSSTNITISIPESLEGTLTIYDVTGKVIQNWKQTFDKGEHQYEISKADLGSEGVYYYRFAAGSYTATKKMILLD